MGVLILNVWGVCGPTVRRIAPEIAKISVAAAATSAATRRARVITLPTMTDRGHAWQGTSRRQPRGPWPRRTRGRSGGRTHPPRRCIRCTGGGDRDTRHCLRQQSVAPAGHSLTVLRSAARRHPVLAPLNTLARSSVKCQMTVIGFMVSTPLLSLVALAPSGEGRLDAPVQPERESAIHPHRMAAICQPVGPRTRSTGTPSASGAKDVAT